jgi:hypothetical protein
MQQCPLLREKPTSSSRAAKSTDDPLPSSRTSTMNSSMAKCQPLVGKTGRGRKGTANYIATAARAREWADKSTYDSVRALRPIKGTCRDWNALLASVGSFVGHSHRHLPRLVHADQRTRREVCLRRSVAGQEPGQSVPARDCCDTHHCGVDHCHSPKALASANAVANVGQLAARLCLRSGLDRAELIRRAEAIAATDPWPGYIARSQMMALFQEAN